MGWAPGGRSRSWRAGPRAQAILEAYAEGVNAYLTDHQGTALSLEYGVLKLLTPAYKLEPWTPLNSLTWAKAMAWDLRGNMDEEIERAILLKTLTPEQVDELFPPTRRPSADRPRDGPARRRPTGAIAASLPDVDCAVHPRSVSPAWMRCWARRGGDRLQLLGYFRQADRHRQAPAGQRPAPGPPDALHLVPDRAALPPGDAACPFEVTGFSFAGAPGVVIGHNDRIAWGFTNTGPDVKDLYIEKINPENPNQYEVNGQWVDMTVRSETMERGGREIRDLTVRSTRHGPILSDAYADLVKIPHHTRG